MQRLKHWARRLKSEARAVYLAYRDPRTPWYAKALAVFVVAYAFSPIDLIPDFIPVLGYLDDLLITPLGLYLCVRLIPPQVMAEARLQAARQESEARPLSRPGLVMVTGLWLLGALIAAYCFWQWI
jgi:uncharacterized membrane protein YkvA (DUF1232 family)